MLDQKDAWETWYRTNPTNWKGSPLPLPELPDGARVLDVGCGTGNTMLQALDEGYDAIGIDLSDAAIDRARERIAARGFEAVLIPGDILDPSLDIGKFDCVLLHHVMNNMLQNERKNMVERVKQMVMDDGLVSFQDLSINDVRYGKGEEVEKNTFLKGDGIRLHFFDLEEIREQFKGLKVLRLDEYEWTQGKGDRKLIRSRISGTFQLPSFSTRGSTSGA